MVADSGSLAGLDERATFCERCGEIVGPPCEDDECPIDPWMFEDEGAATRETADRPMQKVMPPRFLQGDTDALELLNDIARDCEQGELQGFACVVMIDGKCWRYSSVPDAETAEAIHDSITDLAADVEDETR